MIARKRKPKPAHSPDRPAEQLQLIAVTIQYKLPARAAQPRQIDSQLLLRSFRQGKGRGKVTVH
jgi:hypothetical protein